MVDLSWFRRRHQAVGPTAYDKPARERHILSVICSCLSVILLVLSLSLQEWGKAQTDKCKFTFKLTQVILESETFKKSYQMTEYYTNSQQILISCVISVSALAIISSLIAMTISSGYPREKLEFLRHYSVFNIISLLCIVLVAGLWLGVAQFLPTDKNLLTCGVPKKDIESQFSYGYYLMLVGGLFSLGAAAFNLLFARTAAERRRSVRTRFRQLSQRHRLDRPVNQQLRSNPPAYSLVDSTDFSETETETSLSEPEHDPITTTAEPITPPPPYSP